MCRNPSSYVQGRHCNAFLSALVLGRSLIRWLRKWCAYVLFYFFFHPHWLIHSQVHSINLRKLNTRSCRNTAKSDYIERDGRLLPGPANGKGGSELIIFTFIITDMVYFGPGGPKGLPLVRNGGDIVCRELFEITTTWSAMLVLILFCCQTYIRDLDKSTLI